MKKVSTKPPQKILNSIRIEETGSGRPTPTSRRQMMNITPAVNPMPTLCRNRMSGKLQMVSSVAIQLETDKSCSH